MDNKIKVSVIMGAFLPVPAIQGGAVEKLWLDICEDLAKKGLDINLISKKHSDLLNFEICNGVKHTRIKGFNSVNSMPLRLTLDFIYSFFAVIKARHADVVITNTFWSPIIARFLTKSKIWVSVHRFPRNQMRLYKHVDVIQPVSNAVAKGIFEQTPTIKPKVCVIPNFVKTPKYQLDINKKQKQILYVGRLHPEKGVELLVEAFSSISGVERDNWKLLIVGPYEIELGGGGLEYFNNLQKLAAENVEFVGAIFDTDVLNEYYTESSIFVYPSLANKGEAFGLSPLEAMSYGCQTIVSDLDCFKDFIKDNENGFIIDDINNIEILKTTLIFQMQLYGTENQSIIAKNATVTSQKFSLSEVSSLIHHKINEIA